MKKLNNIDIFIILLNIIPWFFVIFYLYNLQIVKANDFSESVEKFESSQFRTIHPRRGQIYVNDKSGNLYPVAISLRTYNLYFNPKSSKNIKNDLEALKTIFPEINFFSSENSSPTISSQYIDIKDKAVLLKKDINEELREIVKILKLDSVFFEEHYRRVYPEKNFLSTIIGFAVKNDQNFLEGKYGIEKYYDTTLKGESGYQLRVDRIQAPISGKDIILGIDYFVQKESESVLKEAVEQFNATGGLIVISDPKGKLIAIAEEPSFDINKFNEISDYKIFNTKFTQNYEPGSVMKTITYLSGIENNVFNENKTYFDNGYVESDGWKIYNFDRKGRGEVSFGEAFEQSLNTGSIELEKLIGHNNFFNTLKKFKFEESPVIDLPHLNTGNLKNLSSPHVRNINFYTASFGHGISISPAHLLSAINTIAANGIRTNFRLLKNSKIIEFGTIIKTESTYKIKNLMGRVIQKGSGKISRTKGFKIGGKTGSAYIPMEGQKGYSNDVINTFVVMLPLTNTKYTILVRIDRPYGLSGVTTVPAAKKMIEFLINYYNLQPDNPAELTKK